MGVPMRSWPMPASASNAATTTSGSRLCARTPATSAAKTACPAPSSPGRVTRFGGCVELRGCSWGGYPSSHRNISPRPTVRPPRVNLHHLASPGLDAPRMISNQANPHLSSSRRNKLHAQNQGTSAHRMPDCEISQAATSPDSPMSQRFTRFASLHFTFRGMTLHGISYFRSLYLGVPNLPIPPPFQSS